MDQASSPPRRLRALLAAAWVLFWLMMTTTAVQDYLRDGGHELWKPVLWEGSSLLVATVLLLAQRRHTRRHDALVAQPRRWFLVQLPWLFVFWLAFVPLAFGIRHGIYALAGQTYTHDPWPQTFFYEDVRITVFFSLFVLVTFGLLSWQAMIDARLRAERTANLLREAQLRQLTQQMQPHFLFNALNTVSALMHEDVQRADALLVRLADMLRATLEGGQRQQVALADELRLLHGYCELMTARHEERVTLAWDVAPGLDACPVPFMCLQPLLENVFRHTVERRRGTVHITVSVRREGAGLVLAVADDTGRLDDGASEGAGIALANLRERLAALHGAAAALTLTQLAPAGVCARIELPCAS
ncbi:histidine kinase [[Empedobacter] haloabium]|uniref:Histidine kinase n=1 Tax=[Empedobacter] haloabium TaxID=592317 RepID=A0ABZ1UF60_9BURK